MGARPTVAFGPRSAQQEAIGEARALRLKTDALKQERDSYVYRAHIGLGNYAEVLDEVKEGPSVPVAHQALRLLAMYLGDSGQREVALLKLEDRLAEADAAGNATVQLVAATIYMHEGQFAAALKAIRGNSSMEQCVGGAAGRRVRSGRAAAAPIGSGVLRSTAPPPRPPLPAPTPYP